MNFYYNGFWRMDWGLGNPNKTATLIACLMIAVWSIALIRRHGFWPALVIFTGLAWCLIQTYSRGGMLALILGLAVLLAWIPRPWPKSRWIAVFASFWVLGAFVLYAKAQARYGQGLFKEDLSISNRLTMWKHVPEMMSAAPWGWGAGKAGDSYTQWFEPVSESENYFNLVNSHFTWMVEWGWIASIFYVFAWLMVFVLCWPTQYFRLKALPLAVWIAFAVGAYFSAAAESPWLWVIPVITLGYVICERLRSQQWPRFYEWGLTGVASLSVVTILIGIGFATTSFPIGCSNRIVTVGKGSSNKTLILVDRNVLGSFYGHALRKFLVKEPGYLSNGTYVLAESWIPVLPQTYARVIISGQPSQDPPSNLVPSVHSGLKLTLVNPGFSPEEINIDEIMANKLSVLWGEYWQSPVLSAWSAYPGIKTVQVNGASTYVPDWPKALFDPDKI